MSTWLECLKLSDFLGMRVSHLHFYDSLTRLWSPKRLSLANEPPLGTARRDHGTW